jgi:LacI family transcriptional regulator
MNESAPHSATISDVARLAGVSIATVSRVINGSTPVIAETAERVHGAIQQLSYVPRAAARVLASRRTQAIGLLVPEISGDFFPPLLRGIETTLREMGYALIIQTTFNDTGMTRQATLGEHNTDGLLVFPHSLPDTELKRLRKVRFPVVLLHKTAPSGLDIPTVTVENKNGTLLAVEHLIQVHHRRRIVFLRGPEGSDDSYWREQGYLQALEANHIAFDPELVARGGFSREGSHRALSEMLHSGTSFDAVFSGDDDSAAGVLAALRESNRKVPGQVSVIGFDDVSFSVHLTPPLTTVHAPIEQVGQEAVRQLVGLIRGEVASDARVTLFPTQLMIRQSCGCKAENHAGSQALRQGSEPKGSRGLLNLITRKRR